MQICFYIFKLFSFFICFFFLFFSFTYVERSKENEYTLQYYKFNVYNLNYILVDEMKIEYSGDRTIVSKKNHFERFFNLHCVSGCCPSIRNKKLCIVQRRRAESTSTRRTWLIVGIFLPSPCLYSQFLSIFIFFLFFFFFYYRSNRYLAARKHGLRCTFITSRSLCNITQNSFVKIARDISKLWFFFFFFLFYRIKLLGEEKKKREKMRITKLRLSKGFNR